MKNYTYQRRIVFAETDMAGIMHFANYYRLMEETEHAFFRSLDLEIMHKQTNSENIVGWPRVSAQCSFEAPIHYDDIIDLKLKIERIGGKSVTFAVEFFRGKTRVAHGKMKTACCLCKPDHSLESILIPDAYRDKLGPFESKNEK